MLEARPATHEVKNQAPPLVDYNLYTSDRALGDAVRREGGAWAEERLVRFGAVLGEAETIQLGFLANEHGPVLRTHDRFGHRIDEVEFHPAYHDLMRLSIENGLHALPWIENRDGAHVARAALITMAAQNESGHGCPVTMTFSSIPALRRQPDVAKVWEPRITRLAYDPRFKPAAEKTGTTIGMAMTEKQGGSDVRANTTRAVPIGEGAYLLTGHKWFCSAPMCDAFLVLAQAPGGLSCFLMPRWTPSGERNRMFLQRLKSKLGNKSNASSEIELDGAWAQLIGEEGRGVPTIIEMVTHTRLDCVLGSLGILRSAVAQAAHHATHRAAFGRKLRDHPLMQNVIADLIVETEAATHLAMRLARAYDHAGSDEEDAFRRLATAVSKYWVCKRIPQFVYEALEAHGGNGYVEESILPRLFRDSPLNSIWEGSGNVICLDVLRAIGKEPRSLEAVMAEIAKAKGQDARLDAFVAALAKEMKDLSDLEARSRRLVERLALALQGSLVVRHAPAFVAEAFCASRLAGEGGLQVGTLPAKTDFASIVERGRPAL